jgi:hypothetical protein
MLPTSSVLLTPSDFILIGLIIGEGYKFEYNFSNDFSSDRLVQETTCLE